MIKMYHFEIEETDDGLAYASRLEQLQQLVIDGEIGKAKSGVHPGWLLLPLINISIIHFFRLKKCQHTAKNATGSTGCIK